MKEFLKYVGIERPFEINRIFIKSNNMTKF